MGKVRLIDSFLGGSPFSEALKAINASKQLTCLVQSLYRPFFFAATWQSFLDVREEVLDSLSKAPGLDDRQELLRALFCPPWPWEPALSGQDTYPVADAYRSAQYGLFRFDGKVYLEFGWSEHPTDYGIVDRQRRGVVHIYLHEGESSRELCRVAINSP